MKSVWLLSLIFLLISVYYFTVIYSPELFGLPYNRLKFHSNRDKTNVEGDKEIYDFIIIGGGSAGSVVASRLSENDKFKVLLIEAGEVDQHIDISTPATYSRLYKSNYDWSFYSEPNQKIHNKVMFDPRGKVLGGSSSINAMIYMRGSAYDYDLWEKIGGKNWSWEHILPYFKKSEHSIPYCGKSDFHGCNGPWVINKLKEISTLQKVLKEAFKEVLKLEEKDDINGENYQSEQVAEMQFNIKNNTRWSLADAFLSKSVVERKNLFIQLKSEVTRLIFDESTISSPTKRVIGVEVHTNNGRKVIYAKKEIILSAGGLKSPQLLMLSGIGNSEELKQQKIKPIIDNKYVGENLQDHISFTLNYSANNINFSNVILEKPYEYYKNLMKWVFFKEGKLNSHSVELNVVFRSEIAKKNGESAPDIQVLSSDNFFKSEERDYSIERFPDGGFGMLIVLLRPKSRGKLSLKTNNPFDQPKIDYKVFEGENNDDQERLLSALETVRKIKDHEPLKSFIKEELLLGDNIDKSKLSKEDVERKMSHNYFMIFHTAGTCAIGSVVNPDLLVYETENLRVVDASIMPNVVGANTNAATVMIAEKASDIIKSNNN